MTRLFKKKLERKKGIWKRVVDLALTDVRVAAGGIDNDSLESLEERLIAADFGVPATLRLVDRAEEALRRGKARGSSGVNATLREEIAAIVDGGEDAHLRAAESGPTVYLMVGVNGVGKTTSVAKLANHLVRDGRSVMVAAADTFRAGAVEQLAMWAERIGADFLRGQHGGDPAAVVYDALEAAEARGTDVLLIDTAGRLHTNQGLMKELEKIDRVVRRRIEGAPHETLMVLDATVGQNAVRQLEAFRKCVDVSGIVLAKMDSSARGGIVVALKQEFGVPVKLVGTGEALEDLHSFDPDAFVEGVFGT
ncbi:MAG: signal recognition particle-docking protein FtsY [Gemmatimonadales bacterium]|nr:signal recognition particle-docking protein FtsY [Gemmatimonadales bacterium]MDG2238934.1 signal recognition particle-docking protein FtsY [Longimicrobiales bacterium]MBT3775088.1 signal recognition particle-docking protein FtsY [Gemmatimonadales bacterium]MBT4437329.1 signal recognition particle-docking protein FtsY [Gemmatimonadales bacterium]MBT4911952.1 signal recognition particle-docking protein FtsY [Gemmatimonadales bacterium]